MKGRQQRKKKVTLELRQLPDEGTRIAAAKHQSYQIPVPLWQDLVDEVSRRRRMNLPLASQNAVAVDALRLWLETHKGGDA